MRTSRILVFLACLCALPALSGAQRARAATLILTGGKVFTADTTQPWAEAVAIRGERIIAVGTTAAVRRRAGRGTREIALAGRVVIPGINDAHEHLGDVPVGVDVSIGASPTPDPATAQVLDSVRAVAARTPPGIWIRATIGRQFLTDTTARRASLDRVSAGHPVLLWTWWGHGAVLNTAGLRALGIFDNAPDPLGG